MILLRQLEHITHMDEVWTYHVFVEKVKKYQLNLSSLTRSIHETCYNEDLASPSG